MRDRSQRQRRLPVGACHEAFFRLYTWAADCNKSVTLYISAQGPTLRRFTQVLEVGNRCSSLPASRMAKRGFSCLKPLENNERLQRQVTRRNGGGYELTEVAVDCSL